MFIATRHIKEPKLQRSGIETPMTPSLHAPKIPSLSFPKEQTRKPDIVARVRERSGYSGDI